MTSIIAYIKLGAEDYLPKPFDPVLLHARLGVSVEKKRMTDELRDLNLHLAARVDETVREVERLTMLRRFVSPQLAEAIANGGESILASHRREITVLFCDLRGFTSFSETAEPEEVMAVLREFHDAVGPMTFAYDGTIAQFTGDCMLVFFNDPVKLEDPSWNACDSPSTCANERPNCQRHGVVVATSSPSASASRSGSRHAGRSASRDARSTRRSAPS